jgi:hypothetical protein
MTLFHQLRLPLVCSVLYNSSKIGDAKRAHKVTKQLLTVIDKLEVRTTLIARLYQVADMVVCDRVPYEDFLAQQRAFQVLL